MAHEADGKAPGRVRVFAALAVIAVALVAGTVSIVLLRSQPNLTAARERLAAIKAGLSFEIMTESRIRQQWDCPSDPAENSAALYQRALEALPTDTDRFTTIRDEWMKLLAQGAQPSADLLERTSQLLRNFKEAFELRDQASSLKGYCAEIADPLMGDCTEPTLSELGIASWVNGLWLACNADPAQGYDELGAALRIADHAAKQPTVGNLATELQLRVWCADALKLILTRTTPSVSQRDRLAAGLDYPIMEKARLHFAIGAGMIEKVYEGTVSGTGEAGLPSSSIALLAAYAETHGKALAYLDQCYRATELPLGACLREWSAVHESVSRRRTEIESSLNNGRGAPADAFRLGSLAMVQMVIEGNMVRVRAGIYLRLAALALEATEFRRAHDGWPARLSDFAENDLSTNPITGKPVGYKVGGQNAVITADIPGAESVRYKISHIPVAD